MLYRADLSIWLTITRSVLCWPAFSARLRPGGHLSHRTLVVGPAAMALAWLVLLPNVTSCWATDYTWVGGGLTNNWGDISNWIGSIPPVAQSSGTTTNVLLRGSGGTSDLASVTNVDTDWKLDSLTFTSQATGSWSLIGGKIVIGNTFCCSTHFIRNSDGSTHAFDNDRVDLAESFVAFDADTADLDFNSGVHFLLNNSTLSATGGNDIFFDGGISGETFISNATLSISGGTTVHIGGTSSVLSQVNLTNGVLQLDSNSNLGSAVNIATVSGTTFNVNGFTENIDQITGSGNIQLGSGALTLGATSDFTYSGVISGTGSITKNQSGVTTFAGISNYTGATNITGGTLRLQNSTTDGSLSSSTDVSISSAATFDLNGVSDTVDSISGSGTIDLGGGSLTVDETAGARSFSGNIVGTGTFRKNGGHALTLSGNNEFTSLIVSAGELTVSNSNNLGANSGSVVLAGTLHVTNSIANGRGLFLSNGTIDVDTGATLTQTGVISNNTTTASLTKIGGGTMILSALNNYSGDTILQSGRLELASSNRIGNVSDLVITGGTFDLNGFTDTVASLGGTGGTVDTGGSSGRLTLNQAFSTTYSGVISGAGGITKQGNGTLSLGGPNSYTGSTQIQDGTLRLLSGGSLGSSTDVSISAGASWDLNGQSELVDTISGAGSILLGGASLSVDQNGGTTTFSGVISESGSLSKSGSHTLVLSGNNAFSDGVAIFGGAISVAADNHLGAATGDITLAANGSLATTGTFTTARDLQFGMAATGTFDVASGTTLTHTGSISGGSDVTFRKAGGGTYQLAAANAGFGGNIVVDGGTFEIANFSGDALGNATRVTVNGGGTLLNNQVEGFGSLAGSGQVITNNTFEVGFDNTSTTFSGTISGNVGGGFFGKAGTGTMTITQPLTYAGATRVNNGTLRLSGNGRLPDNSDVLVSAVWDLNSQSDTIDALTGAGSVLLGSGTLTVGANNGSGDFAGVISEAGSASQGALVKVGSGRQTLSGNNTYTFDTRIDGGILQIATSNNLGLGSLRMGNGARLQVTGTTTNARMIDLANGGGVIGVTGGQTMTQSGVISGIFGGLTKADPGTLVLTASNTYAGGTNIEDGILRLQAPTGRLSDVTDVNVSSGAIWDLNGVTETVDSIAGGGSILLGNGELTVQENGGTRIFSGVISEPGGLMKGGTHVLELSGANTFSGAIAVNGGTLSVSNNGNLGATANGLLLDGGTLRANAGFTSHRDLELGPADGTVEVLSGFLSMGSGTISGPGQLRKTGPGGLTLASGNTYTGGTLISAGALEVDSNSGLGANSGDIILATGTLLATGDFTNLHRVILQGAGTINVDGATLTHNASLVGSGELTKSGDGLLLLSMPATHRGNTTVQEGTLRLDSGSLPDDFDVTVHAPGVWDLKGTSDTIDGLFGNGTVLLGSGDLTLGAADGDGNYGGRIFGPGRLLKIGSGVQSLTGVNYSQSSTDINDGILRVASDNPLGLAFGPLGFDGGTLNSTASFTIPRSVNLNSRGGTFDVDDATTLTIANAVTGVGGLTKAGLGTLILQGNNNFGGPMSVLAGQLQLDTSMTFGGLSGNGDIELGLTELTVNSSGNDSFGGIISGVGGKLTKDGPGTLTLTGINTYTGGTCILDGVLQVSQSENLGILGSLITFDGGTLNTTASFNMIRGISLKSQSGAIDVDAGTQLGASGNMTGVGSLTKSGDGILSLVGGFSSYEGGTNILAGEVEINNNINLGNTIGPLTLDHGLLHTSANVSMARLTTLGSGGGVFRTAAGTLLNHSGAIIGNPGAAGVTKRGGGDLRWQGTNTFAGDIVLEEGRLQVDASGQLGSNANVVRMRGGGLHVLATMENSRAIQLETGSGLNTIEVASGAILTQSGMISDGFLGPPLTLAKVGGGDLLLTVANDYSSPTEIMQGTLRLADGGQLPDVTDVTVATSAVFDLNSVSDAIDALAGSGDVILGSAALTIGADAGGGFFDGLISGPGSFVKVGLGKQTLSTRVIGMGQQIPNTYLSGTQINGGILSVESDGNLGDPAGPLGLDNGELEVEIRGEGGSLTTMRTVTLGPGGGTLDTVGEASATIMGVITGPGSLTKQGLGVMTLMTPNTYGGDTIIDGGLIRLAASGQLPDTSRVEVNVVSSIDIPQGFQLNNVNDTIDGLDGNGEVDLGAATLTIGSAGGDGAFGGTIHGAGGVAKAGAGTQILSGSNSYSGGTDFLGGVLQVPLNQSLGVPIADLSFDGGTLRTTGSFTMTRPTMLAAGSGTLDTTSGVSLTHNGVISGGGGLQKAGDGTLILGASNTYTGPTTISGGVLQLTNVERLDNATDVTVAMTATFDLNSFNETINSLSGSGIVTLGSASLVVGINNGSGDFSGVISGTGDILKEGSGVQTLSGQNNYAGATFVDGGELVLNGGGQIDQSTTVVGFNIGSNGTATMDGTGTTWDLSGNLLIGLDGTGHMNIRNGASMTVEGDVRVGSNNQGPSSAGTLSLDGGTLDNSLGNGVDVINGTLQGQGMVLGDVDNFARLAPGNSAGVLTVNGNVVQSGGASLAIEVGGRDNSNPLQPQFDVLDVTGNLAVDGTLELALLGGFTPSPADTFTVADATLLVGSFTNVLNGSRLNLSGGGSGSFQVNYGPGSPFGSNLLVLSHFEGSGSLLGDFDGNGIYECSDIDQLVSAIAAGSNNAALDLTGDGLVNLADRDAWLAQAGSVNNPSGSPYLLGDANLDGVVDVSDFNIWNGTKFTNVGGWCSGDFNADGFSDVSDFNLWNGNKFQSSNRTAAVPEPHGIAMLFVAAAGLLPRRSRARAVC